MAAGRAAVMRSTGSGSMITPVENGRICAARPRRQCLGQGGAGGAGVGQAVGAGAGIGIAGVGEQGAQPPWPPAKCSRQTCTGAAQ